MAKDPSKVLDRWSRNLAGSAEKYKESVAQVTESPGVTAAANLDTYRQRVLEALDSGKTKRAMEAVSLEEWKRAASGRGASNLASAASDAQVKDKMRAALTVILPYTQTVKETIRRMPRGTKAERKARMDKAFEMMSALKVK